MTLNQVKQQLLGITIGHHSTVCGKEVFRWTFDNYEVDTFCKTYLTHEQAAKKLYRWVNR